MTDDAICSFDSPESSSVAGASYNFETEVLTVRLRRKDEGEVVYRYGNVPLNIWQEFDAAPSKGVYFSRFIRPMFGGKPV